MNAQNKNIIRWTNYRIYRIHSDDLESALNAVENNLVDGIEFASWRGFKFLKEFRGNNKIKALVISGFPTFDINILEGIHNIEAISIDRFHGYLDFKTLFNLKYLYTEWHENMFINSVDSNLEVLHLSKYKSKTLDLIDFPYFMKLKKLELSHANIHSLKGINQLATLVSIELNYLNNLLTFDNISLKNLVSFSADMCKKINDHEVIANCLNIEYLKLNDCGQIKTIKFLNKMPKLKSFRFYNTIVDDGDLIALDRIDDVSFKNRSNYTHKMSDFQQP